MSKLVLYLPTKGRVDHQPTLQDMPLEWLKRMLIVCPREEIKAHEKQWKRKGVRVLAQGSEVKSIASARAWIFRHAHRHGFEKIAMLDDDIRFATRVRVLKRLAGITPISNREWSALVAKTPELGMLTRLKPEDKRLNPALYGIEKMLGTYAHSGIHARLMSNQHGSEWRMNTRIQQVYAYHVPTVMRYCVIGRQIMRDDFDYQLQLLTMGFPCPVYCWVVGEQSRGFHGKGGQESSRTMDLNTRDAHRLAAMYPGLVTVVQRGYKNRPRTEVIVRWQKAAAQGEASLLLGEGPRSFL
jgi:hypothetical protein